ncbi:hypothetical protein D1007_61749 [Hordeum vulgare]|nr:hypothetical protein D1007_61749 [Hordeum vulgare]
MVTASSGIAAEAADGLHPATEASESTYSMAATGYEAVAATILTDEAKEKGYEAWHLTGSKFPFPSLFAFALCGRVLRADNVKRIKVIDLSLSMVTGSIYNSWRDATTERRCVGSRESTERRPCGRKPLERLHQEEIFP